VAAALAAFAALRLLHGGDAPAAPPVRVDGAPGGAGTAGAGVGSAAGGVSGGGAAERGGASVALAYVHVAGAVRHPGLYRVPPGSRVATAIERAGGPLPRADLGGVNLAARVDDGQQVVVPKAGAVAAGDPAAAGGAAAAPGAGVKVSLGSATVEQLDQLDGIGPTLAARIVEYRQAHGGFRSIDDLGEVDGIGEKRLEALREAVQP
jgi:competence protein ComEA